MEREIISIETEGKRYKFYKDILIRDAIKIDVQMSELLGGWDKWSMLEAKAKESLTKHKELNEAKYGKDGFVEKNKILVEEGESEKGLRIYGEIYDNIHFTTYYSLIKQKEKLNDIAKVIVLNAQDDIDLSQVTPDEMENILSEVKPLWNNPQQNDKEKVQNEDEN